jgi:hypothetical protein
VKTQIHRLAVEKGRSDREESARFASVQLGGTMGLMEALYLMALHGDFRGRPDPAAADDPPGRPKHDARQRQEAEGGGMSPADLAQAEREAYARLRREASEEAHEDWLEVRRAIEHRVRSTGGCIEHHDAGTYTIYSLGYFNTLHIRSIHYGRL